MRHRTSVCSLALLVVIVIAYAPPAPAQQTCFGAAE
jgi:hypothetical protein